MVTKKIILLLIIAAVIFASGCGSTKNDEDQAWLRSTNSDLEMMQQDKHNMLKDQELSLANLDACDKVVTDAKTALRNNQKYRPTSSKFQKAQNEWNTILNDYILAAELRSVAVQKMNTDMSEDPTIYPAAYEALNNSNNAMLDAQNHRYILYDYIDDE